MNRYEQCLSLFYSISVLFFLISCTEAMEKDNQLVINEESRLLNFGTQRKIDQFDIESLDHALKKKIVVEKPGILYRFGIPVLLVCNVAMMGVLGYGLIKVSQTANQYAPQVQSLVHDGQALVSDGKKVVDVANLIGFVFDKCPQGKNYLARELSEIIPAFLRMCNCSDINKK